MTKISRRMYIETRVVRLRKTLKVDSQKIRVRALNELQEIFEMASALAKGKYEYPDGKQEVVPLRQRQKWVQVATYTVAVINKVAVNYDEQAINKNLEKLRGLINATRKLRDQQANERSGAAQEHNIK
jgi:hypothetical protein